MTATRAKQSMVMAVGTIALTASLLLGATGASAAPSTTPRPPQPDLGGEMTSLVSRVVLLRSPAWANSKDGLDSNGQQRAHYPIGFLAEV